MSTAPSVALVDSALVDFGRLFLDHGVDPATRIMLCLALVESKPESAQGVARRVFPDLVVTSSYTRLL